MKKRNLVLTLLILTQVILFGHNQSFAFHAEVLPHEVMQGDAFVIKVTGLGNSGTPDAFLMGKRFYFNGCGEGCFIAVGAIGLEAKPGKYTVKIKDGEDVKDLKLTLKRQIFRLIRLTLPENKVFLSPRDLERAEMEEKKLASLWKIESEKLWKGNFIMPLENDILTAFGTKRVINRKKVSIHKGIDIRGNEGTEVSASNKGRVVLAEELFFGGNTLILDHGQGIYTIYMHLSGFSVRLGDIVSKSDIIGFVGSSGRASGPHLHFGVKILNTNANPLSFVKLIL